MKHFTKGTIILIFFLSVNGICQSRNDILKKQNEPSVKEAVKKCPANADPMYNRQTILEQIARTLNSSIPEYEKPYRKGFHIKDDWSVGFNIQDLTDISNSDSEQTNKCINFINNHVYHVYPVDYAYSFSHIVILEDGNLKIFKSINCKDRGDSIEDVLSYLNQKQMNDKEEIINRVKNYRKYGGYIKTDNYTRLLCKEVSKDNR